MKYSNYLLGPELVRFLGLISMDEALRDISTAKLLP